MNKERSHGKENKNLQNIPECENTPTIPAQLSGANDDSPCSEKQIPSSGHIDQLYYQDPGAVTPLAVLGQSCRLSPRVAGQKKSIVQPSKTNAFVESRPAPVAKAVLNIQQCSDKSDKNCEKMLRNQNAESECALGHEKIEVLTKRSMQEAAPKLGENQEARTACAGLVRCSNVSAAHTRSNEEEFDINVRSVSEGRSQEAQNHAPGAGCSALGQSVEGTDQQLPTRLKCLTNDPKEDQRAFFIDFATGESCALGSLSTEAASFRGNRTLALRQLLSQQKIEEASHRRKKTSGQRTRRRSASQGRVKNVESMLDAYFDKDACTVKHHLPVLLSGLQNAEPSAMPPPRFTYYGVKDVVKCSEKHDHAGDLYWDGSPRVRLRHRSDDSCDYLQLGKASHMCGSSMSTAHLPGPNLILGTKTHHASLADKNTSECPTSCPRCYSDVHVDTHLRCHRREHTDHSRTVADKCDLSPSAEINGEQQLHTSQWNILQYHSELSSRPPLTHASATSQEMSQPRIPNEPHIHHNDSELQHQSDHNRARYSRQASESNQLDRETMSHLKTKGDSQLGADRQHLSPDASQALLSSGQPPAEVASPHHGERSLYPNANPTSNISSFSETTPILRLTGQQDSEDESQKVTLKPPRSQPSNGKYSHVGQKSPKLLQLEAMPHKTSSVASGTSNNRPNWHTRPDDPRHIDNSRRKSRVSLFGRAQRVPPAGRTPVETKNWTSVTLVSPQHMEMTLSLSTHLPDISDQRGQRRHRPRAGHRQQVSPAPVC